MTVNLKQGDIFLTKGTSFVSWGIRFFSRTGGEPRTEANHVGIVVKGGTEHSAEIVEALTTVRRRKMSSYAESDNTKVAIFRPTNVTPDEMKKIVDRANGYVGAKYGYVKLVAHLLDYFLGGRYVFRRFASMDKYPICSWVVAYAYADGGYTFGVDPGGASPDDIWDFCIANPDKYTMVHPMELI